MSRREMTEDPTWTWNCRPIPRPARRKACWSCSTAWPRCSRRERVGGHRCARPLSWRSTTKLSYENQATHPCEDRLSGIGWETHGRDGRAPGLDGPAYRDSEDLVFRKTDLRVRQPAHLLRGGRSQEVSCSRCVRREELRSAQAARFQDLGREEKP